MKLIAKGKVKLWKLNNTCLHTRWIKKENIRIIRTHLERNKNKNIAYYNLRDTEKAALKGKFIAVNKLKNKKDLKSAGHYPLLILMQINIKILGNNSAVH